MFTKQHPTKLACIALLLTLSSCGQSGENVIGLGNYWYVLPSPKKEFERVGDHGLIWKCNGWDLLVDEDEKIYLNEKYHGRMSTGDELTVTWEGKVFLNNKEIAPIDEPDGN